MKLIIVLLAVTAFLAADTSGQSGRRTKSPSTTPAPPVQAAPSDGSTGVEETGYSESASRSSVALRPRKNKNDKRDDKKDEAAVVNAPAAPPGDEDVIKVETNLITIPVSVADRNGFYIANLAEKNFQIFENGVEQKIEYFGTTDKPFTVVLLIDVSPSTAYKIEEIQAAAEAFVSQLLPHDQVMVIEFDSGVRVLTEATGDREKIAKAIRRSGFGGGTSLYQAVDFSLRRRLNKIEGRKAIVLFTDGVDTTSSGANALSTLEDAEESEAVIFPIYYNTFLQMIGVGGGSGPMTSTPTLGLPGSMGGARATQREAEAYTRGLAYLNQLALVTAGKLYRAESTPGGLTAAFESIAEELRRQYVLGYYPQNEGSPGDRKAIKVRVNRPKLIIRSRDSYIVGAK